MQRTRERIEFLSNLLICAIEHAGYGFPGIVEFRHEGNPADVYAVIYDRYDEADAEETSTRPDRETAILTEKWRVDIDTMAKGLGVFRKKIGAIESPADWCRDLLLSDRTNGDDGDYDVIGALAVLECAIFGDITYN